MDLSNWKGRTAVVTGAASGIGRAFADKFAAEGMNVVLADIEDGALAHATKEVGGKTEVLAVRCDVSKGAEVNALAARAAERFGNIHVMCNNAGVASAGLSWETSLADWEWVVGVNLWGVIHGVRAFVPRMLAHGEPAHVVNTASVAGLASLPIMSPYCVTKHGVVTLSESLFHELSMATGGRVGVSVLCPGWVQTKIAESERNRPAGPTTPPANPLIGQMMQAVKGLVAGGIPPSRVADLVMSAIRERRFYVLPHPDMAKAAVKLRLGDILEGRSPTPAPAIE